MRTDHDAVETGGSTMVYPLRWPHDRPRAPAGERGPARFELPLAAALDDMLVEIERMGGTHIVVSSNMPGYEKNGVWRPYADAREPDDPGVAVYFVLDNQPTCMTCDCWSRVRENIRSIGLTLEAMRGMERWGAAQRRQAFAGFRALPPAASDWRTIFGVSGRPAFAEVKKRYHELAAKAHPDHGGDHAAMAKLNAALEAAQKELS
jgi:hypothetical protein